MSTERSTLRLALCLVQALALVVLSAVMALAEGWGEVRIVETPVNVRQQRDPNSPIVRTLKPGEKVRVDFVRPSGWGTIFELGETQRDETKALGFADVRLLKPADAAAAEAKPADSKAVAAKTVSAQPAVASRALTHAEPAQIRLVEARTEVHKERSLKSAVVAVLAPGERVQTGFPRDGFLAVFRLNDPGTNEGTAVGFVPQGMVKAPPPAAAGSASATQSTSGKAAEPNKPAQQAAQATSTPAPEVKGAVKSSPALLGNQPSLSKQAPVRITSDKMVYNQAENSVMFLGNVHGTHTDMAIWAERITAYFADKKKSKDAKGQDKGAGDFGDSIERIVAEGNVRLVANKNEGACAKLTYEVQEAVIRMDGNPILREGQNTIRGESIKFYIRENRSEVLSGSQRRVEAIFFTPKGEGK
ncbi:MAG: LptA/OstA family protein [Humidesulfovibrio sp.]|uniref:LptA/OstA family protein n=1 Tax=Humidesulfovibrio sp. TaxID=2910988 RepID=UPI0027FA0232|nr:LptA/OstA family protein [Humidesulfovibrio sp.]MDQ7834514.1 LptA/OstA family protein [Humidesulfovibrio sp.]